MIQYMATASRSVTDANIQNILEPVLRTGESAGGVIGDDVETAGIFSL